MERSHKLLNLDTVYTNILTKNAKIKKKTIFIGQRILQHIPLHCSPPTAAVLYLRNYRDFNALVYTYNMQTNICIHFFRLNLTSFTDEIKKNKSKFQNKIYNKTKTITAVGDKWDIYIIHYSLRIFYFFLL